MACKTPTIFLVSAQLQCGKNAFGEALAAATDSQCLSFADPLKEIAIQLGMPRKIAYGSEAERRGWTKYLKAKGEAVDARVWLQWIGTEFGRDQVATNLWVELLLEKAWRSPECSVVVTDARFKNELLDIHRIAARMGVTFRFVRIRIKRPGQESSETHQSETEQLSISDLCFEHVVVNDGTLEELVQRARDLALRYVS